MSSEVKLIDFATILVLVNANETQYKVFNKDFVILSNEFEKKFNENHVSYSFILTINSNLNLYFQQSNEGGSSSSFKTVYFIVNLCMFTKAEYEEICQRIKDCKATKDDILKILRSILYVGVGPMHRVYDHFEAAIRILAGDTSGTGNLSFSNVATRLCRVFAGRENDDLLPGYFRITVPSDFAVYLETIIIPEIIKESANQIQTGAAMMEKLKRNGGDIFCNNSTKRKLINHCFAKFAKDFPNINQVGTDFASGRIHTLESEVVPCFHRYTTFNFNLNDGLLKPAKRMIISLIPEKAATEKKVDGGLGSLFHDFKVCNLTCCIFLKH